MLDGTGLFMGLAEAEGETTPAAISDFSLENFNANSTTYQQAVSPRDYLGQVSGWYFAYATCGYCTSQFAHLNSLQDELESTYPTLKINLMGINQITHEAGNGTITQGKDLPWLQDVDADANGESDVWSEWDVEPRDVVILDGDNVRVGTYNLTTFDLGNSQNYETLRGMLVDAAMDSQKPWKNHDLALDVNDDGHVSPIDALLIINELNDVGSHALPAPTASSPVSSYLDNNGDNHVSPADALWVINALNSPTGSGEGETVEASAQLTSAVETESTVSDTSVGDSGESDVAGSFRDRVNAWLDTHDWLAETLSTGTWETRLGQLELRWTGSVDPSGELDDLFADHVLDWLSSRDVQARVKDALAKWEAFRETHLPNLEPGELRAEIAARLMQWRSHRRG